jgi:hypothetical protein
LKRWSQTLDKGNICVIFASYLRPIYLILITHFFPNMEFGSTFISEAEKVEKGAEKIELQNTNK